MLAWGGAGVGLQWLWPLAMPDGQGLEWVTRGLLVPGVVSVTWALITLFRAGTTTEHSKPTTRLVTTGPFRLSRNPIYLGLTAILVGLSVDWGNPYLLVLALAFPLALQRWTVGPEEAYLEREFGAEFRRYRSSVRRWL
jgi:protein-S-isoprenylcysteine O-methyltransferase Ste14